MTELRLDCEDNQILDSAAPIILDAAAFGTRIRSGTARTDAAEDAAEELRPSWVQRGEDGADEWRRGGSSLPDAPLRRCDAGALPLPRRWPHYEKERAS